MKGAADEYSYRNIRMALQALEGNFLSQGTPQEGISLLLCAPPSQRRDQQFLLPAPGKGDSPVLAQRRSNRVCL